MTGGPPRSTAAAVTRPRARGRGSVAAIGLGAIVALAGPRFATAAPAPGPAPVVEWAAPPGCPDAATIERTLTALLRSEGDSAPSPAVPSLVARAIVRAPTQGQWVLNLEIERDGVSKTRRIEAETCRALASATVLVVAIAFDPRRSMPAAVELIDATPSDEAGVPPAPPAPPPRAFGPPPAHPGPAAADPLAARDDDPIGPAAADPLAPDAGGASPSRAPVADAAPRAPQVHLRLLAGPGLGPLPRPTGVLELAVALAGRGWRAELGADLWIPVRDTIAADLDARFGLASAVLRGCGVPSARTIAVPLCAALDVGAMTGRGVSGFEVPRRVRDTFVAARLGAFVAWRVHPRVSLWLGGELVVALRRPRFGTDDQPDLVVSPRVGGIPSAGVELRLGRPKDSAPGVL